VDIVEKPKNPSSNYVNTGLWMFLPEVFTLLKELKKSPRGEYEITDVLSTYAKQNLLTYAMLKSAWTDAGSFESLFQATLLMHKLEEKKSKSKGA
jgi:glucose-1-phosphate thymidylyltransferase